MFLIFVLKTVSNIALSLVILLHQRWLLQTSDASCIQVARSFQISWARAHRLGYGTLILEYDSASWEFDRHTKHRACKKWRLQEMSEWIYQWSSTWRKSIANEVFYYSFFLHRILRNYSVFINFHYSEPFNEGYVHHIYSMNIRNGLREIASFCYMTSFEFWLHDVITRQLPSKIFNDKDIVLLFLSGWDANFRANYAVL